MKNFLKNQLNKPVLFIVFNRPDTTLKVFESIRKAKPKKLYIACDGPRDSNDADVEKIKKVREICKGIDWTCELKTRFRKKNLGCKYAVSSAINWFFENEEEGIILEDDTLPSNSFFEFCSYFLDYYRDEKVIWHIGGYKPKEIKKDNYSITFTRYTHIWGWATWKDRWKHYDVNKTIKSEDLDLLKKYEYFRGRRKTEKRIKILKNLFKGEINTWDYQWNLCVRMHSGLAVRCNKNLVENIGHNHTDATHTFKKTKENKSFEIKMNELLLPPWILPNRELENIFDGLG